MNGLVIDAVVLVVVVGIVLLVAITGVWGDTIVAWSRRLREQWNMEQRRVEERQADARAEANARAEAEAEVRKDL